MIVPCNVSIQNVCDVNFVTIINILTKIINSRVVTLEYESVSKL